MSGKYGDPVVNAALGRNLTVSRRTTGYSVHDVGYLVGSTGITISRIERGMVACSVPMLLELARLYEEPIEELLSGLPDVRVNGTITVAISRKRRHLLWRYRVSRPARSRALKTTERTHMEAGL